MCVRFSPQKSASFDGKRPIGAGVGENPALGKMAQPAPFYYTRRIVVFFPQCGVGVTRELARLTRFFSVNVSQDETEIPQGRECKITQEYNKCIVWLFVERCPQGEYSPSDPRDLLIS